MDFLDGRMYSLLSFAQMGRSFDTRQVDYACRWLGFLTLFHQSNPVIEGYLGVLGSFSAGGAEGFR